MKKLNVIHVDMRNEAYGWKEEAVDLEDALVIMEDRIKFLSGIEMGKSDILNLLAKGKSFDIPSGSSTTHAEFLRGGWFIHHGYERTWIGRGKFPTKRLAFINTKEDGTRYFFQHLSCIASYCREHPRVFSSKEIHRMLDVVLRK